MIDEDAATLKQDEILKIWRKVKVSLLYIDILYTEFAELKGVDEDERELYDYLDSKEIQKFIKTFEDGIGIKELA